MEKNIEYYPKISIITPSFNQGQFIEETIQSVLNQDYPNLEYIVIDGGSSDNTVEIIRKYSDFITYWISEKDHGQSDAINKGFRISTGEIVAWLNSDDYYCPGTIKKVIDFFKGNPDVAVVYGDFQIFYEKYPSRNRIVRPGKFNFKKLIKSDFIGQPAAFIRRDALFDVGLLDETLHNSLDYDLFLKLGLKYRFDYIPEILAVFRWHEASKSGSQEVKFAFEDFCVIDRILLEYSFPQDIFEAAYSHLLESLIIFRLGLPIQNNQHLQILDPSQLAELNSHAFFDYVVKIFDLQVLQALIKGLKWI